MKPSLSKSMKTTARKKRSREEAAGSAGGSTPLVSPPRPNPNKEWKKSKAKTGFPGAAQQWFPSGK
jgi:hypothetical protein